MEGQSSVPGPGGRPAVSVVVPFAGTPSAGRDSIAGFQRLRFRAGDELIFADNTPNGVLGPGLPAPMAMVRADAEASSYYARNRGAERARNEWILFVDADCRPGPDLLDQLFDPPPGEACGIVAGGVVGAPGQPELLARWARSRNHLSEEHHVVTDPAWPHPAGITGNLLVRREAWESLGGFHEGIRSGGDVEFCWRAQDCGWKLEHRPHARVEHVYGTSIRGLARQAARHNAGRLWVRRRYPGAFPPPRALRPLARCAAGVLFWSLRGRFERAAFKAIDSVSITGGVLGWYVGSNQAPRFQPATARADLVVAVDAFPARSETFVYNQLGILDRLGTSTWVESSVRPVHTERSVARSSAIHYLEDDPPRRKIADLGWLVLRHPLRALRDARGRRHWGAEEDAWSLASIAPSVRRIAQSGAGHIHAHFAAGAALNAMRVSRLLDIPYSVTAHAYDLFQKPRNLEEKLSGASFVAGECQYTVEHMHSIVPDRTARIYRIATGVDPSRFESSVRDPSAGRVVAVGRLVEKKGFTHLIRAAHILRDHPRLESVEIAGEGPLRAELEGLVRELAVGDTVSLRGNVWGADGVRSFLQGAHILVISAVPAKDGDRDALPVISYEALAMQVPVIASDYVGLPEVIRPPWGRLVPPGDAEALARKIAELLEMDADERAAMGRRGREFVMAHGSTELETAKLRRLILEHSRT